MEYVTLTADEQATTLRGFLKQAEHDHLVHSIEVASVTAALDALPPKPPEGEDDPFSVMRAVAEGEKVAREANMKRAEQVAILVKEKLDDAGIPYVEPKPPLDQADATDATEVKG